jgi:hypothetical protein
LDWLVLVAGADLALTPMSVEVGGRGTWAMALTGSALVVVALIALSAPGAYIDEGLAMALGVVALVAPWVFGFTGSTVAAWTAWVVGVVVIATSTVTVPMSRGLHRHHPTAV